MHNTLVSILLVLLMASPAAATEAAGGNKVIQDIHWPEAETYCTFMRKEQVFDFDNPATWRFVYFTTLATFVPEELGIETEADRETAFARLFHLLRELQLVSEEEDGDRLRRVYRTYSKPTQEVVLDLVKTDEGLEYSAYEGTMSVSGPFGNETVDVKGDCGV